MSPEHLEVPQTRSSPSSSEDLTEKSPGVTNLERCDSPRCRNVAANVAPSRGRAECAKLWLFHRRVASGAWLSTRRRHAIGISQIGIWSLRTIDHHTSPVRDPALHSRPLLSWRRQAAARAGPRAMSGRRWSAAGVDGRARDRRRRAPRGGEDGEDAGGICALDVEIAEGVRRGSPEGQKRRGASTSGFRVSRDRATADPL